MLYVFPSGVSSNSICMSMMCVIPAFATFAMFSDVQIPPPTAIRSVNHVISIPVLYDFFPYDFFGALTWVPHSCRALCDRVGILIPVSTWVPHPSRSLRRLGIFFGPTQTATRLFRSTAPPHFTVSLIPVQRRTCVPRRNSLADLATDSLPSRPALWPLNSPVRPLHRDPPACPECPTGPAKSLPGTLRRLWPRFRRSMLDKLPPLQTKT